MTQGCCWASLTQWCLRILQVEIKEAYRDDSPTQQYSLDARDSAPDGADAADRDGAGAH